MKTKFSTENKARIQCLARKRYVQYTPEEEVRQRILAYLNTHLEYPLGRMMVEVKVEVNTMPKRADIVVAGEAGEPRMVIECKRPSEKLNEQTFAQIAMYTKELYAPYLLISNGLEHFMFYMNENSLSLTALESIPNYSEIC